ncbi:MAG TPA: hypothetical protein VF039_09825, partial [Longimicrobiales bacterium]
RGRRGPRRGAPVPPPTLLPGQTIDVGGLIGKPNAAETPAPAPSTPASPASAPAESAAAPERAAPVATPAPERSPEIHDVAPLAEQAAASVPEPRASRPTGPMPKLEGVLDPKQLGLPTEAGSVVRYLTNRYRGVGDKTAEQLVEAFGAEHVFAALKAAPDRVVEVLGSHRANAVLDAWRNDYARRSGEETAAPSASSRSRGPTASSYDDDDDGFSAFEPESIEADVESTVAPGTSDVERELPVDEDAPERESPFPGDREVLASDIEREGTPDLWSDPSEPRA